MLRIISGHEHLLDFFFNFVYKTEKYNSLLGIFSTHDIGIDKIPLNNCIKTF